MQQTNNTWIQMNKRMIEALKRQLLEYDYSGSYGGAIDLMKVNNTIDGAIIEIMKLQKENETLSQELNRLLKEKKEAEAKDES
jgi:hypothetical protein